MFSQLIKSAGFRTTYKLWFETVLPAVADLPRKAVRLPTIVPVARGFFDADVTVTMPKPGSPSAFTARVYGLGNDIFKLLLPCSTIVHVELGYDDGTTQEVLAGILQSCQMSLPSGEGFYMAELKGIDALYDQLQNPDENYTDTLKDASIGDAVRAICSHAGVPAPNVVDDGVTPASIAFNDANPLAALQDLARRDRARQIVVQVRDGGVAFGPVDKLGKSYPDPITDGGLSRPLQGRCGQSRSPVDGQDFDMAGDPQLRPNDLVVFGTDRYRIESITHTLTRDGGYRCVGRALAPAADAAAQQQAGRPTAAQVVVTLRDKVAARDQTRPAVSAGEVDDYQADAHTATVKTGAQPTPAMTSPTIEAPLRSNPAILPTKPLASPFAFDQCGLVVPVYPKMRTLLVHGWNEPDDAVIDGFLWAAGMKTPPNEKGDWWLCLPTEFAADGFPRGATADDLIDGQGQRVISVKGMTITVGAGLLNEVGSRPAPPTDESLTIRTDGGASIVLKGGEIRLSDGGVTVTIGGGKVDIA